MPVKRPVPTPRRRGRPAKISREKVIEAVLLLLEDAAPDEVSMADVAARLNVPVMSLYNHFPNTSELLQSVADHTFGLFRMPAMRAGAPWQDELLAWLRALAHHCQRYPVALRMISIEGRATPAYQRIVAPLLRVLQSLQLDERRSALLLAWVTSQAMGLIYIEDFAEPARRLAPPSLAADSTDAGWLAAVGSALPDVQREEVLELGFRSLIAILEEEAAK
tara:strand:- start:43707 stop:44369 length:663 start_codon:yes stop_codon:yes gene_type:complete